MRLRETGLWCQRRFEWKYCIHLQDEAIIFSEMLVTTYYTARVTTHAIIDVTKLFRRAEYVMNLAGLYSPTLIRGTVWFISQHSRWNAPHHFNTNVIPRGAFPFSCCVALSSVQRCVVNFSGIWLRARLCAVRPGSQKTADCLLCYLIGLATCCVSQNIEFLEILFQVTNTSSYPPAAASGFVLFVKYY